MTIAPMPAQTSTPSHCPICGQRNLCAMELERATGQPQGPCWCTQASFPQSLLDQVPAAWVGTACICADCARKASDQEKNAT